MMPKKAHTAKIKKESMSKPIGRPGSPSLYMKKKEKEREGSSLPKPSSPLSNGRSSPPFKPSSPVRPSSPQQRPAAAPSSPTSSPFKEPSKKRKSEEPGQAAAADVKHRKVASSDEDLITEQEVIDTLRGKTMTTKEFLMSFRKRIKKNHRNRDIITALLKKVAKSNRSADPNTRTLELKPELQ
jgi:transcription initiation factor TFIIF subunit alpha